MALCEKAFALELEVAASQSFPSRKQIVALESHFEDVYMDLQPTPQDYQARKVAVDFVYSLARDKLSVGDVRKQYGLCHARAFGSFTMDMFTSTSDLDISLNVELGLEALTREERVKLLRKLTKLLYGLQSRGFVREIQPVFKAKVPVVKFLHCNTGIECDVSIENKDGIIKSEFLRIFSSIDSRFRKLCFLFKAWANGHGINSSKDHTLNSLSIILLVAFHLQTRVPAILPPFSMLLKGVDMSTASHAVSFVQREVNTFKDFGKKNGESVVQLFNSFLTKIMAVKQLWHEGLCASAYEGTWTSTTDPSWIFVEDFTSLSQNAARAVNGIGFDAIYECCNNAFLQLKSYFLGKHEAQVVKSSLFNLHTTSAVHKRKRNMEDHPDSGNHQPMQDFMIQQSVAEDKKKILSYAPSSRLYDSRFGQMIPGETIFNHADVLGRGYLAQVTQSNMDSYLVPTVNSGLLREHPTKRMRLQHPILGDRYLIPFTDLQPLPNRLSRDDQFYPGNIHRRLQIAGQQSYLLPEPRIGMHEQRDLLGERTAEQTYPGAHCPPSFSNDGVALYTMVSKDLNRSRYSNQAPLHGYGFKMYDRY